MKKNVHLPDPTESQVARAAAVGCVIKPIHSPCGNLGTYCWSSTSAPVDSPLHALGLLCGGGEFVKPGMSQKEEADGLEMLLCYLEDVAAGRA